MECFAAPEQEDEMSGEYHRVVFGAGADLTYRLCNSEKEARGLAADKIHRGSVSQVAVEECRQGQWVSTKPTSSGIKTR
jgi:hypothetical protein